MPTNKTEGKPSQTREDLYRERLSLIRNVYGDLFDAEFVTKAEARTQKPRQSRQKRLSDACENAANQIGLAMNLAGEYREAETADLIYAFMRDLYYEFGEAQSETVPLEPIEINAALAQFKKERSIFRLSGKEKSAFTAGFLAARASTGTGGTCQYGKHILCDIEGHKAACHCKCFSWKSEPQLPSEEKKEK